MYIANHRSRIARIGAFLLAALITVMTAVSCDTADREEPSAEIVFTDALGRKVCLDGMPERVACLLGSFADVWMLAGGEVCAAAEDAWDDYALLLDGAVSIGGAHSPNAELLLSADPDFVIASASTASHVELCALLESVGITVAYFDVMCFDDYLSMLSVCTEITGREDLLQKNGVMLQTEIDEIKARFAEQMRNSDANRVLLLRAASGFVKAKGSEGTVLGEMLADLGCINLADSDTQLLENLSVEAVMEGQPYRIFVAAMGSNTEAALQSLTNMMEENPAWQSLEAVKNGRMHIMDRTLFHLKPNARWAEAYQTLYEILIGT